MASEIAPTTTDGPNAKLSLFDPIQFVPGVGSGRASLLRKLGIEKAVDLLFYFPRTYEVLASLRTPEEYENNASASILGEVLELDERIAHSGKHILGALVSVGDGKHVRMVWFNQAYRKQDLRPERRILATGVLRSTGLSWEMIQPQITYLNEGEEPTLDRPLPVYGLTEGLTQPTMRRIFRSGIDRWIPLIDEVLPTRLRELLGVLPIHDALAKMHWPETLEHTNMARNRFVIQELFVLQLAMGLSRQQRQAGRFSVACPPTAKVHSRILNRLGYILTGDQTRAINEVGVDMALTKPMNRLLQGDVGCGKTVVAQYAMLLAVAHGHQAALMVPTEVLARQHDNALRKSLASSRVRIGLLTGSQARSDRQALIDQIAAGSVDLIIGTQALLNESIQFASLALVVVDEQHKFGVEQRALLRRGTQDPHTLILSATPIPRTIAMTAFGDLDVSIIREMPPGRSPVKTYLGDASTKESWWNFVEDQIRAGRQAFVIAPRVAESDSEDVVSAIGTLNDLAANRFRHRRVGLLHGQLSAEAKEHVLASFAAGDLDILVATTVIEVGIDVPNVSVMTILDADRLGLAQLHQLRGRVGRGRHPGFVCAFSSNGTNAQEHDRLKVFERISDGFELAEADLRLRGAGDLLGSRQHGQSALRVADLARDVELVYMAQRVARDLLEADPNLADDDLVRLKKQVLSKHGAWLETGDVG